ncbi:MAG: ComF family protein [Gemmataceae bacterium]|nr:ComF family protein [Gemmataceae bacterium]
MTTGAPETPRTWLAALAAAGRVLLQGFGLLLYPNACRACTAALAPDAGAFCPACRGALLADTAWACPRCAATVGPYAHVADGCPACRDEHFAFDRALRLGVYAGLVRDVVLRLKHYSGEPLAEAVGDLWAAHAAAALRALRADVVVPVPLHWRRRWRRGYNQSEALGRRLAVALGVPCRPRWLRRVRATKTQHYLDTVSDRQANVRNAFAVRAGADVRGKTVLLVEDVMRTCSTVHEAARPLHAAGAARVAVAALARA